MKRRRRIFLKISGLILIVIFLFGLWGLSLVAKMATELPNPEDFSSRRFTQSTKIYDRTGQILLSEIHGEGRRTIVPFDQIPDHVKKAALAVEDRGFYEHRAVSFRSIARAFFVNIIKGEASQGGSTITQQLAKNAFLTPERKLSRKIKEVILSYWIEKKYSKDEILGLYLNQIPYGANAYGVEAASQTYFGKSVKDLTIAEGALLASMLKAPSYYSPWGSHRDQLENRKNYALNQMEALGFIDAQQKEEAQKENISFLASGTGTMKAPHFVMAVKDYINERYGEDMAERGGLKIITTLDMNLQEIAERSVKDGAARNSLLYNGRNAALVAEDPKTGQVLAMVGSRDYFAQPEPEGCAKKGSCQFEGNFNVATQGKRQPGSSIKPFAYITAFQKGYGPQTMVFDLPTEFSKNPGCPIARINYDEKKSNPQCFHPGNFDNNFRGPVDLKSALAQSINVPAVKVLYLAGLDDTIKTAQEFGITSLSDRNRYGLSLVLGGGEVSLSEMVHAYTVFSQDGTRHDRSFILEIEYADGQILEGYKDNTAQVVEPQYARIINDILSDAGARAPLFGQSSNLTTFPDREVALKTGTTNDYKDAWAIGYTPSLAVGVWAGNNNNLPMQKHAGSILAAVPIWSAFLREALLLYPEEGFAPPDPVLESKTMLNGVITTNGEAHDILYFVDRADPQGPPPTDPGSDAQFINWEAPVSLWAQSYQGQMLLRQAVEEGRGSTTTQP